jgi:hypothetical protein
MNKSKNDCFAVAHTPRGMGSAGSPLISDMVGKAQNMRCVRRVWTKRSAKAMRGKYLQLYNKSLTSRSSLSPHTTTRPLESLSYFPAHDILIVVAMSICITFL